MSRFEKFIKGGSITWRIKDTVNVCAGVKGRFRVERRFEECTGRGKICRHGYRVIAVFQEKCLVWNLCHSEQLKSGKDRFLR
jgi:hypothetical protein